ncbi:DUF3592 domain-containing protein [Aliikangiella coralliicola]|uniref:DUF3592 domain-containing protein n=1 Tax=Aliikangiella coralliicola TaxID=2592383 RepID=A0A545UC20_9GAMM|nr:DUF3592 domain-containing protein [Aliikangiella coralliicola]
MLVLVYFLTLKTQAFLDNAYVTKGEVIELIESSSSDSNAVAPLVTFLNDKGQYTEFVSSHASYPPAYEVGELVDVYYLPEKPDSAKVGDFFSIWGLHLIFGILGCVFFSVGVLFILVGYVNSKKT